ncbi:ABC transporter ATP-binding protein [Allobaculum mucilyticum]|uniref:ABC transporter ATP-binding protein n=1 Tax=Allobaculum mucilyticum TaxID=2834459 RepID=UPI001E2F2DED|nr:ABC transporter ATP-binding protein [Allobaculum mucilyticum]UNT95395.1 ABC transporter ATP-binding protein [Allobaculum mucilyticum]
MDEILKVTGLSKNFGGLAAVSGINMNIMPGELIGLIGPNGAGKTTLFNLLTGVYEPSEGLIELNVEGQKKQIGGMKPYKITALGMARTFQNIRLFKSMTVLENVKLAMHKNAGYGVWSALLRNGKFYNAERWIEEKANEYLREVGLYRKRNEKATNLPYGEQRRLEIARALAVQPRILFLDEPAAGMNPQETDDLTKLIRHLRDKYKLTVILIEHDMSLVMNLCERIFVLNYGKLIASGTPDEIKNNEFVISAYLGEEM